MDRSTQYRSTPSRPQQSTPVEPKPSMSFTPPPRAPQEPGLFKKYWWIGAILLALLVVGWLLFGKGGGSQIDGGKYQAVFLNNGQVYFGKLKDYYTERPYLTDVYYMQSEDGTAAEGDEAASSTQKLIKLGKEIHGPENKLILNKDAILFVENLTEDGEVVKVIKSDNKQ